MATPTLSIAPATLSMATLVSGRRLGRSLICVGEGAQSMSCEDVGSSRGKWDWRSEEAGLFKSRGVAS